MRVDQDCRGFYWEAGEDNMVGVGWKVAAREGGGKMEEGVGLLCCEGREGIPTPLSIQSLVAY